MKGTIKKLKTSRALIFSIFAFLMLSAISIINSGFAYAINGELDYEQRIPSYGFNKTQRLEPSVNKSTNLTTGGVVVVGKEIRSTDNTKIDGFIMKYGGTAPNMTLDWHATEPGTEILDVIQIGNYIVASGVLSNGKGTIVSYDMNGNEVDYYPNSTSPLEDFDIGAYELIAPVVDDPANITFRAVVDKTIYFFDVNENGKISRSTARSEAEDKIIYISPNYTVTSKKVMHSSPYWEVSGNFVAAEATLGHIFTLEGNSTVKMFDEDDGTKDYEITVPNAELHQLRTDVSNNDTAIFAIGKDTAQCDIGGLYNPNNVVYKITSGTIAVEPGVVWEKSIYDATGPYRTFDSVSATYFSHMGFAITGIESLSGRLQTTFYALDYSATEVGVNVNYVIENENMVSGITNCGVTNIEKDTFFYPKTPRATGFTFDGWYTDPGRNNKFTNGTKISADTTLYAAWNQNVYDVTFSWSSTHPDITAPITQHIAHGSAASKPQDPSATGYNWNGWHVNSCANPEYDFSTPVTGELHLVGCWGAEQNSLTFVAVSTDNPSDYRPTNAFGTRSNISYGATIQLPQPTARGENANLYTFDGWYTEYDEENGLSNPYEPVACNAGGDNCVEVKSDITLYGAWINHTLVVKDDGEGGIEISWPDGGDTAYIDEDGNLVLDNFTGPAIDINTDKDVNIILENENMVSGCITAEQSTVTISGTGSLATSCINGQDVVIDSVDDLMAPEIHADNTVTIKDSDVASVVIASDQGDITIKDSAVTGVVDNMGVAIASEQGDITIDNSEVDALGLETNGNINIINGSQVVVNADDDPNNHASLYTNRLNVSDSNLDVSVDSAGENFYVAEGIFEDGDSSINIEAKQGGFSSPILMIKNGDFNISSEDPSAFVLNTYLTQIEDGTLTVEGDAEVCQVITLFAQFNGGTTTMVSDSNSGAVCTDLAGVLDGRLPSSADLVPYLVEQINSQLDTDLVEGEYIVFNDGDTTLKAKQASALVIATSEEQVEDTIKVNNELVIQPDGVEYSTIGAEGIYVHAFSNGKAYFDDDGQPVNLASYVHVYRPAPPVPDTDEETPNTVDFQIVGLAGAVFISLMVEGMIIADLYRRLHGYEEEIAAVDGNAMMTNEPVYPMQAQTEEKQGQMIEDIKPMKQTEDSPAEEIAVKFNKHDDNGDTNGPGDEYYY